MNKVLSIQSRVIHGYVGCNISDLAISLNGIDVLSLPTVLFSTHTDNENVTGQVMPTSLFNELFKGLYTLSIRQDISHIITGYFGSIDEIETTHDYILKFKSEQQSIYICDPVMGDTRTRGLYIQEELARNLTDRLIPICDIITPNHFELEYILGSTFSSVEELKVLIAQNDILNDKIIIVTSAQFHDTSNEDIEVVVITGNRTERIRSTKVDIDIVGTGDMFTALLTSQIIKGKTLVDSARLVSLYISRVLEDIAKSSAEELNSSSILKFSNML